MKDETQLALDRFWQFGILPGDFLLAVLSNDLFGAIKRADLENRRDFVEICSYVYNEMPGGCWGDWDRIESWAKKVRDENWADKSNEQLKQMKEIFDPRNLLFP